MKEEEFLCDKNDKIIFNGYFKKGKYDGFGRLYDNENLIYEGFFTEGYYNGKGILYYKNNNNIEFKGIFKNNYYDEGILYYNNGVKNYEGKFRENEYEGNGILYDLKGEIIYKGEFKNNLPKEGKNIKIYELNGYLKYEGDFYNFTYNGNVKIYNNNNNNILIFEGLFENGNKIKGITYENGIKKYEGEYKDDKYNGYGKLYEIFNNKDIYLYYQGNFKDNQIFGKGIKYYKNGSKKIDGYFLNINSYKGIYYDPNGNIIFEGEMTNEILFVQNKIKLFNDGGNLVYNPDIYKEEIIHKKIENEHSTINIHGNCDISFIDKKFTYNILFYKFKDLDSFHIRPNLVGIDWVILYLEYKKKLYEWKINQAKPVNRFKYNIAKFYTNSDIIVIIFDFADENSFNENLIMIEDIKKDLHDEQQLIYLLGVKLEKPIKKSLKLLDRNQKFY